MELTPQRLREVEFKERWRGYDPEEVDDLLERVAAGIEEIESRVRQATERAARAEQRASEGGDADETLRRTLVLAQRTADAAIADADERAAARLSEAEERATSLVTEAEQRATSLVAEAEAEARRITEDTESRLRENVSTLESARSTLQADVDTLGRYLVDERDRLRTTLHALIERIDTDLQSDTSAPAVSAIEVPEPSLTAEAGAGDATDAQDATEDATEAEPEEPSAIESTEAEHERFDGDATEAHDVLAFDDADAGDQDDHVDQAAHVDETGTVDDRDENDGADQELVLSGPGREIDTEDDAFFAQLRGALDDDEPLGPRDEEPVPHHVGAPAASALFDQELSEQGRLGPFLRRKRRDN